MMTSAELLRFIRYEKERGLGASRLMRAEYHRRWAEPFSIVILTIIGASVASRKQRGGMGLHLAIGVAIGSLFVFFSKFALTFSTNLNMPPMLAMWLPNMILGHWPGICLNGHRSNRSAHLHLPSYFYSRHTAWLHGWSVDFENYTISFGSSLWAWRGYSKRLI